MGSDFKGITAALYLNLLSKSDEIDLLYDFRFLTPLEAIMRDKKAYWFEVGKVLDFASLRDINRYLRDNGLIESEFAEECLFKLYEVINERRVINYYLEASQKLEKVLNIFIRVNSGGTILSYSDLLLSIATAQWKTKDAREEITKFVDGLPKVTRTCLRTKSPRSKKISYERLPSERKHCLAL